MNDDFIITDGRSLDPDILQKLSADVADSGEDVSLRKWADLTDLPQIHRDQLDLDTDEFLREMGFTTWTIDSWRKFLARYPLVIKLVPAGREELMTIPHFREELANGSDARPVVLLLGRGEVAVFLTGKVVTQMAATDAASHFRQILEGYYSTCQQAFERREGRRPGAMI